MKTTRIALIAAVGLLIAAPAQAAIQNPASIPAWNGNLVTSEGTSAYTGPMGCPDPDVFAYGGGYVASCTSGTLLPGMPIYYSVDLQHWELKATINPPAAVVETQGQEWADEIHYIDGQWTAWYAVTQSTGKMAIVVSTSPDLFSSDWQTQVVYADPHGWWAIDPTVMQDPTHPGLLDMAFQMEGHLWITGVTRHGFHVVGQPRSISSAKLSWEHGWEEGPVLWTHNHTTYLLYNSGNTWDGTYSIGIQILKGTPLKGRFIKQKTPLLATSAAYPNLAGPGIGAQPFIGPNGEWIIAHHVDAPEGSYGMAARPLCFERLNFNKKGPYVYGAHPWPSQSL